MRLLQQMLAEKVNPSIWCEIFQLYNYSSDPLLIPVQLRQWTITENVMKKNPQKYDRTHMFCIMVVPEDFELIVTKYETKNSGTLCKQLS